jgi:hypothetical protein
MTSGLGLPKISALKIDPESGIMEFETSSDVLTSHQFDIILNYYDGFTTIKQTIKDFRIKTECGPDSTTVSAPTLE